MVGAISTVSTAIVAKRTRILASPRQWMGLRPYHLRGSFCDTTMAWLNLNALDRDRYADRSTPAASWTCSRESLSAPNVGRTGAQRALGNPLPAHEGPGPACV